MKRLLKIIISILYLIVDRASIVFLKLLRKEIPASCVILFYHSIFDNEKEAFDKHIKYLIKKTIPIKLDKKVSIEKNTKYSIVTFDDAFISAIKNGLPILIGRKIPFVIFIPAGYLGEKPGWQFNPGEKEQFDTVATIQELKSFPQEYVVWGSHTVNHPRLSALDQETADSEIIKSKEMLESYLKTNIKYLAFPYGDYDNKTIDLCKKAGYEQVFTIKPESPYSPIDKFEKGRIEMRTSDWPIEYKLKILGAYSWMPLAIALKNKYLNQK